MKGPARPLRPCLHRAAPATQGLARLVHLKWAHHHRDLENESPGETRRAQGTLVVERTNGGGASERVALGR